MFGSVHRVCSTRRPTPALRHMSTHLSTADSAFLAAAPRLPLELVHIILRSLNPSLDKATLAACSLVHSSWSAFSKRLNFRILALHELSMPHTPHSRYSHIRVPDFNAFLDFMRQNAALAGCVQELAISGSRFESTYIKHVAVEEEDTDGDDSMLSPHLGVHDEFEWANYTDFDSSSPARVPYASRWMKLPRAMLDALIGSSRLFPRLHTLTLASLFVELGSLDGPELPLQTLVLHQVGTTRNTATSLIQFLNAFDPISLVLDQYPANDLYSALHPSLLPPLVTIKRTTSLELGASHAAHFLDILRASPALTQNLTTLQLHVNHASEVGALSNLLKTVGRRLKELSIDLKPVCYVARPEVHMDRTFFSISLLACR